MSTTRINSTIDTNLESEFRKTAANKFGFKKGCIQKGLEEALKAWLANQV